MIKPAMGFTALAAVMTVLAAGGAWAAPEPRVELDPRLEALAAVHLLADSSGVKGFRAPDLEYVRRARKAFAPFKDHKAVRLTAALPAGFGYISRSDAVVRRGPLPGLAPHLFTPDFLIVQAGGRKRFEEWISALADFARVAGVSAFVRDNAGALDPALAEFRDDVARRRYIEKLERYTGVSFDGEYAVTASVFHMDGSQINSVVRREDGGYFIQSVIGARLGPDGSWTFSAEDFVATAGHEISHGLLDIASELSRERIARSSASFQKLSWNCYGDWNQCVKETIVRAVMLRLIASELGDKAAARHLESEDPALWPYLEPMVEKLALYEKERARWPDLYVFYPRLLEVLPEGEAPRAPSTRVRDGLGPEWLSDETSPFSSAGPRAAARRALDRLLAGQPQDVPWLRRRAAFRLAASDAAGAERDADAALAVAPADPGSLLARSLARGMLSRGTAAAEDLAAAVRACAAARDGSTDIACAAASRGAAGGRYGGDPGPDPRVGPGVVTGPQYEPAPGEASVVGGDDFEFVVDSRVELLSEVLFSTPLPSRPASRMLSDALRGGMNTVAPLQILFSFGEAPELAPLRDAPRGAATEFGGEKVLTAFMNGLRAQARDTDFAARWSAAAPAREALIASAAAESSRTLAPSAVSAWLGTPFPYKVRFVLSETLPSAYAANTTVMEKGRRVEVRTRSLMGRREKQFYFSFDDFGGSPAHELAHTITDPLVLRYAAQVSATEALMLPQCTDNWSGCVLEHLVLGVTLRALRADKGEEVYRRFLDDYSRRGFRYLPAMCRRLAEYETPAARAAGFAAFMPRAMAVFQDELKARDGK